MKLNILLAYAMIVVPAAMAFAQTDTTKDETSLTLAAIYSTNASYYGQTAVERLPYVLINATLRTPFNMYFTAGGYTLLTVDDGVSAFQAGTGFEFELGKKVELSLGYVRSFYAKESPLLQASNTDNVSASMAIRHLFKTEVTGDYMFGKEEDYFVTLGNSKRITIGRLTSKDVVMVEPGIDVVAGTQRYYQAYVNERWRIGRPLDFLPIISGGQEQAESDTTLVQSTSFKIISYTLQIPVYYFRANYAIAATYQLSVLDPNVQAISRKPKSFLNIGFHYQF